MTTFLLQCSTPHTHPHASHNAADKYPTMHHFVAEMCTQSAVLHSAISMILQTLDIVTHGPKGTTLVWWWNLCKHAEMDQNWADICLMMAHYWPFVRGICGDHDIIIVLYLKAPSISIKGLIVPCAGLLIWVWRHLRLYYYDGNFRFT